MGRAAAGVAIAAIIAVTILLLYLMHRRKERTRELRTERDQLAVTLTQIRNELATQIAAGYFDPLPVRAILTDFDHRETNTR